MGARWGKRAGEMGGTTPLGHPGKGRDISHLVPLPGPTKPLSQVDSSPIKQCSWVSLWSQPAATGICGVSGNKVCWKNKLLLLLIVNLNNFINKQTCQLDCLQ